MMTAMDPHRPTRPPVIAPSTARRLTVHARRQYDQLSLEFNGVVADEAVPLAPTETTAWNQLAEVLDDLGAAVETTDATQGFRLVFSG